MTRRRARRARVWERKQRRTAIASRWQWRGTVWRSVYVLRYKPSRCALSLSDRVAFVIQSDRWYAPARRGAAR